MRWLPLVVICLLSGRSSAEEESAARVLEAAEGLNVRQFSTPFTSLYDLPRFLVSTIPWRLHR